MNVLSLRITYGSLVSCFRAPELFFGPRTYDAVATDLWSLGVTIAHFFTSIRLKGESDEEMYDDDDYDDDDDVGTDSETSPKNEGMEKTDLVPPLPSVILPRDMESIFLEDANWFRESLFDPTRGVLAMFWEICKIRGTPNEETWPVRILHYVTGI